MCDVRAVYTLGAHTPCLTVGDARFSVMTLKVSGGLSKCSGAASVCVVSHTDACLRACDLNIEVHGDKQV